MKKTKIRLFLGGYVDNLNAQNINCRALSEHLDPERFEIMTMRFTEADAKDFVPTPGVKYLRLHLPARFDYYRIYAQGIAWADVAYLPKGEKDGFCRWWAGVCRTKVFTTLEGLIGETDMSKFASDKERKARIERFSKYEPHLYAITRFLKKDVARRRGYHFADKVLYLGVEAQRFLNPAKQTDGLRNVCFIGNMLLTKNIHDFFRAARELTDVQFHIIGAREMGSILVDDYIRQEGLSNVLYHGRLDHAEMARVLERMDIMFFPSRSEGFPKVHLETACAGVPTICYRDYGADEWITTGKDGFVVDTCDEAVATLRHLQQHPELLREVSANAVELGKKFDWSVLVKDWEEVIENIYYER